MRSMIVRVAAAVAVIVGAIAFGRPAPAAHADPTYIFLMNQGICTALTAGSGNTCGPIGAPFVPDYLPPPNNGDGTLVAISDALGNNNHVIEPSDFQGVADFSGGQLMQRGGDQPSTNVLSVVAFVASVGPVTFHTSEGFFAESGTTSSTWTCTGTTALNPDSDCGGPNSTAAAPYGPDHVVLATLECTVATCPNFGTQNLTVEQGGIVYPVTFTVVGEPRSVQFFTLETAIQAGVPVPSWLSNQSATQCSVLGCTSVGTACPFSASLSYIQKALGEAEKTVLVARAIDINGTAIAGAWINWTVDNNGVPTNEKTFSADGSTPTNFDSQGILSQPYTPTLNLGGFGYGAPNILCAPAGAVAGKVTVRATISRTLAGTPVDPSADPGSPSGHLAYGEFTFDVVGAPAAMTLTADPATVPCDGNATSKVSAALTDAAGNAAVSGTAVHFDVQVLGTANPIDAVTNDKGIATSTITPLSSLGRGVPVTVSVSVGGVAQPNLTQQILVNCGGAAATPSSGGSGGAGAGTSAPGGTITGPNTGTGGIAGVGSLTWWPALGLVVGGLALLAARYGRFAVGRNE